MARGAGHRCTQTPGGAAGVCMSVLRGGAWDRPVVVCIASAWVVLRGLKDGASEEGRGLFAVYVVYHKSPEP
jgi:hypothetical protein